MLALGKLLRIVWRLTLCCLVLVVGLLIELLVFPFGSKAFNDTLKKYWSRMMLACAGVKVRRQVADEFAVAISVNKGARLLISNHCSWLDILLINSVIPASFVAKAEIRRWPIIGWVVSLAGTIFIDRGMRSALRSTGHRIEKVLAAGGAVAIFAEGTTNDMHRLLPFHSNLLHLGMDSSVSTLPIALSYHDRSEPGFPVAMQVQFVGNTTIVQSIFSVLGARSIEARLSVLAPLSGHTYPSRHALGEALAIAISESLNIPFTPHRKGLKSE